MNYTRESANILLEAAELQEKKGNDYNNSLSRVSQSDYYQRGVFTILDIAYGKILRMYSVLELIEHGGNANFESIEDSAIDLINYSSFIAAYMRGDVPGQTGDKDIFNKKITPETNINLIPTKFRNA